MIKNNKLLIASLIVAAIVNLISLCILNIDFLPDFILLTLLFWLFTSSNVLSISIFWSVGLLADIFLGDLLGQNALTYASCYFMAQFYKTKIMLTNNFQLSIYIFFIFLGAQIIMLFTNLMHELRYPGLSYFLQSLSAGLICYLWSTFRSFKFDH